jgi:hypothetical protein
MAARHGTASVRHDPELTWALGSADDNESPYDAVHVESPVCVRLLLGAGARVDGTNALAATITASTCS